MTRMEVTDQNPNCTTQAELFLVERKAVARAKKSAITADLPVEIGS